MQKIKDKNRSEAWGKKIKVSHLQTAFTIFYKNRLYDCFL